MLRTARSRKNNPRIMAAAWRGTITKVDRALAFYRPLVPFCRKLREQELSYRAIARQLNESGYRNIAGHPFTKENVAALLRRDERGRLAPTNPNIALRAAASAGSTMDPDDGDDTSWWFDDFDDGFSDPDDPGQDARVHNGPGEVPGPTVGRSDPYSAGTFVALAGASEWGRDADPDGESWPARAASWDVGPAWNPGPAISPAGR